jgi:hypothetical protein
MKVGHLYEITLKNGDELYGYTVYEKTGNEYVVGYDGIDGNLDFRRIIKEEDIGMCAEVVV